MKIYHFIGLASICSLWCCQPSGGLETPNKDEIKSVSMVLDETPEDFLDQTGVYDILLNPEKSDWQTLHNFYLEARNNPKIKQHPHFIALTKCVSQHIILHFGLLDDIQAEAQTARLFYFEEMKLLNEFNPKAVYLLLEKLRPQLNATELKSYAQMVLKRNASLLATFTQKKQELLAQDAPASKFATADLVIHYSEKLRAL
ncbi:MAG: hypothetical protein HC913_23400 [Microscillaceae bacterium]|nr:hypothetical protein [Microscillaceae bacterium]